jgi:hypothetical protein
MRSLYYIVQRKYEVEVWKCPFVLDGTHTTKLEKTGSSLADVKSFYYLADLITS